MKGHFSQMSKSPFSRVETQFWNHTTHLLTLSPNDNILDWSNLKGFSDDNFKFDEMVGSSSKGVENTVGKGENARYEQFLIFP